jgi:phage tail-like protein
MAKLTVNAQQFDPYKNFKFRVKFDASPNYVVGVSKMSALKRTTEMVKHREGGDPSSRFRGRTKHDVITLEHGVTHDPAFEAWANRVGESGNAEALAYRNLTIDVFNEAGQKLTSYKVYRARVSEFTVLSDLDANANAIMIEKIKIEHEGYERDNSVKELS